MGWVTSVLTTTDFIPLPSKGRTPGWLSPPTLQNLYKRQLYCVDSDSSSQVRPCDALFEPEKRPEGGKPSQNLAECCKRSGSLCQVRSSLHFSIQKNGGREMISPVSQVVFQSQKRKRGFTSFPFLKSPQRSVLQQQRLRRDITISLYSNNVSLTKIPWFGNLSTFLSFKSLIKLKTLPTNKWGIWFQSESANRKQDKCLWILQNS